jgi:pyruvate/2-oxoglutarate/acetoin dehydrogenase E1 component
VTKIFYDPDVNRCGIYGREVESYFDELSRAMTWLGKKSNTIFIGQAVVYPGTAMFNTLKDVPMDKRLELPVAEEMQMGMSLGLSLSGLVPISMFPRWNFLLCGISALVNHLDKYSVLSDYQPHVIIRTGIGSVVPLDPQFQHKGDFTEAIQSMCKTAKVTRIESPRDVVEVYSKAYHNKGVHIICEVSDFFDEEYRKNYERFRITYNGD